MRLAIHQPEFAPWVGFFHKVSLADRLILLDDVQFSKNYFQNRNRVLMDGKACWMTVPVEHSGLQTRMNEVRIARKAHPQWASRMEATIFHAYHRAFYFKEFFPPVQDLLRGAGELLLNLNIPLLRWMLKQFGLSQEVILSSSFGLASKGSQRILDLCQAAGAKRYISGVSGREYLDLEPFQRAGISVEFQEFHHPIYPQLYPGFVPRISALEALFLFGPTANRLLEPSWTQCLETVFT